ncbi:MAG: DUF6454 family protein [Pseudomonadales bacterium]|nr:DUF6454 family protein [Pseudomonadales bacterium]
MRFSCALFSAVLTSTLFAQEADDPALNFLLSLSSDTDWNLLETTPLQFAVHHPQGMTRVDDVFYMTSVETLVRPVPIDDNNTPYDRTAGSGVGHLFKFDEHGKLLTSTTLGEGSMYHPGGIDYDGEFLWVSVAEYRPDSHSIIYRVDPETLDAEEMFRFDDHLGGILRNSADGNLYGMSWASRTLYRWQETNGGYSAEHVDSKPKSGSDVDYQDCQLVTTTTMACSGIRSRPIDNTHLLTIGGIELVDLENLEVLHKIRVTGTAPSYEFLTRNPFYYNFSSNGRGSFYFVPEDDRASLYHYAPSQQ